MKEMKVEILTIGTKKGNKYGECNVFLLFVYGKLDYSIVIDSCEEDLDILTKKVINEYGIKNFDIICWTHPHDDHSYGMLKLLQEYSNKHTKIVIPSELGRIAKCMTKDCKKIYDYTELKTLRRQTYNGEVVGVSKNNRVTKKFFEGKKKIKFIIKALAPITHRVKTEELNCKYDKNLTCYHQFNEFSVVLFIRLGQFRFLFTADVTNGTIKKFRLSDNNEYRQFKNILFLKIPHHGSLKSNALLNKFNTATCENMICVTTAFQIGNVMLPNKGILDAYAKLGNVYCTSGLYSRNKTYGIVKSIFKFGYDGEKLNIEDIECKTEGDACKYETVF